MNIYSGLIDKYGYPLYVYETNIIRDKIHVLKNGFNKFKLLYSMKCNPNKNILKIMHDNGVGIDAASSNEVLSACELGFDRTDIFYSSPGKRDIDILKTADFCNIVADSINEIALIDNLLGKNKKTASIGVRINAPNYISSDDAFEVMSGGVSKFGIDLDFLLSNIDYIRSLPNIKVNGIHIYFGSQILNSDILLNNFNVIAKVAVRLLNFFDIEYVDFGGGFGVKFSESDVDIDINNLAAMVYSDDNIKKLLNNNVNCIIESGRFLVSESGCYLTKIVDIKYSGDKKFLIVYGGINGFFRPVFTGMFHNISIISSSDKIEKVSIAGNLCTPLDIFCEDIFLQEAKIGDILKFDNAGAYGYSMSLLDFISHDKPHEIFIER